MFRRIICSRANSYLALTESRIGLLYPFDSVWHLEAEEVESLCKYCQELVFLGDFACEYSTSRKIVLVAPALCHL